MYGAGFHCCISCVVGPPNTPGMDPLGRDLLGFHPPSRGRAGKPWISRPGLAANTIASGARVRETRRTTRRRDGGGRVVVVRQGSRERNLGWGLGDAKGVYSKKGGRAGRRGRKEGQEGGDCRGGGRALINIEVLHCFPYLYSFSLHCPNRYGVEVPTDLVSSGLCAVGGISAAKRWRGRAGGQYSLGRQVPAE